MRFNITYFTLAVLLFITEVLIALFLDDAFIRPFGGDFLVVILVYCSVKAFFNTSLLPTAVGVLLFAYAVELAQYLNAVQRLGLSGNRTASTVMGTSFSWTDMLMYTLGILFIILIEKKFNHGNAKN